MKILTYIKYNDIKKLVVKNLKSIDDSINIIIADDIEGTLKAACENEYNIIIVDGDYLDGKFRKLRDLVKNNNTFLFVFFSYKIKSVSEKFMRSGADFCFDYTGNFDQLINTVNSVYNKTYSREGYSKVI